MLSRRQKDIGVLLAAERRHVPFQAGQHNHFRVRSAGGLNFFKILPRGRRQVAVGMVSDGHDLAAVCGRFLDDFGDSVGAVGKLCMCV